MKSTFSAVQLAAINRFCKENGAVPQLSTPPFVNVRFKLKSNGEYVEKSLSMLIYEDKIAKEEEQKTRADEKKKAEREERYRPRGIA